MLTQQNITDKNFTFYKTLEDSIAPNYNRNIYLGLATKDKTDEIKIEFPVKLTHFYDEDLITITTFYTNPRLFNEYLFVGIAKDNAELIDILSKFKYEIESITIEKAENYYGV